MLTLLLCFGASWMLGAGEARRVARATDAVEARLHRLALSRVQVMTLASILSAFCVGELLLELPPARAVWWLVAVTTVYVFQVLCPALWGEAVRPVWDALSGGEGTLPELEELLRSRGLHLLPGFAWAGVCGLMLTSHPPLSTVLAAYAGYLLLSGLAGPGLLRLATPSRRPTAAERRQLRVAAGGLALGEVRVRTGAGGRTTNAFVGGLWPTASRIYVTERLLETFDDDELGFVLAHEVAHRDRWHMALRTVARLVTSVVALLLGVGAARSAASTSADETTLGWALVAGLFALTWCRAVALGALRVRQEHIADAHAVRRSGVAGAQRALVRLAAQNGVPMEIPTLKALCRGHPAVRDRLVRVTWTAPGVPAS